MLFRSENHPPNGTEAGLPGVFDSSNCITCTSILLKNINYIIYMLLSVIYLQYERASWGLFFTAMKNACRIIMSQNTDCVYHNTLWKILQEMGIPDHLTCLLRNLYARQEATVRTGHRTTDWFQIRKVCQSCILSPCLFN